MNAPALQQKIARVASGGHPRVLDLFSGCGGLSLGFQAAGFEISAAVEFDPDAAKSHGMNFHKDDERHWKARDIIKTKPSELTEKLGLGHPALAFDVIIGGPPCQAFARVGRSKLREIADHPEAFRHDDRARLIHYDSRQARTISVREAARLQPATLLLMLIARCLLLAEPRWAAKIPRSDPVSERTTTISRRLLPISALRL